MYYKKNLSVIFVLTLIMFLISATSSFAYNEGENFKRISGESRFQTAIEIAREGWIEGTDTVILTTAFNFPDALAGTPLAHQLNAPILLTKPDKISEETLSEIVRLGANKVIILGGTGAVSESVENDLRMWGRSVERIAGANRFETAEKISKRLYKFSSTAVITDGFNYPDALSIASYAASKGYPILLSKKETLPKETSNALEGVERTYVIGGEGAIANEVFKQLPNATRISGSDRYDTGAKITSFFDMDTTNSYVATGSGFADALTGSALAAKNKAPVLLVATNKLPKSIETILEQTQRVTLFGGTGAINKDVTKSITDQLQPITEPIKKGTTVQGNIITDTAWTKESSPYYVVGTLQVFENATLKISEGVEVIASENVGIRVAGKLEVLGTNKEPVKFTSPKRWRGIEFINSNSSVENAHIDKASYALELTRNSVVKTNGNIFTRNHYVVRDSYESPEIQFTNNTVLDNSYVFDRISPIGESLFKNNVFKNNESVFHQGSYSEEILINENNFINNRLVVTARSAGYYEPAKLSNNWWGTTNTAEIDSLIFDKYDDVTLSIIKYLPIKPAEIQNIGSKLYSQD